jgi:hypothetical protein
MCPGQGEERRVPVQLSAMERRAIRAALGEICFGLRIDNFSATLGTTEDSAKALFERLDGLSLEDNSVPIDLSHGDVNVIAKAHRETLRQLGPEEYSTRTGVTFAAGKALAQRLGYLQLRR